MNDCVCRIQNFFGGTIVLFQFDNSCVGEVFFKIQNVADVSTSPAINTLVVVPYHAQVLVFCRQHMHQFILRCVGILIFVYHDIAEAFLIFIQHFWMGTEQQHCLINQIVKVQSVAFFQQLLIKLIYLCQTFAFDVKRVYGLCIIFPADHFFFLFADLRNGCTDRKALVDGAHIQAFEYFLHDFFLIVCVINRELTVIIQIADFPAQDTHAGRMECADPDIFCTLSHQFVHTFPHFFGCFVGESNCKNIPGFYACFQ